jgi:hypothetical protein
MWKVRSKKGAGGENPLAPFSFGFELYLALPAANN